MKLELIFCPFQMFLCEMFKVSMFSWICLFAIFRAFAFISLVAGTSTELMEPAPLVPPSGGIDGRGGQRQRNEQGKNLFPLLIGTAESSEVGVFTAVGPARVILAAEVASVMECLVGGLTTLEKELMAKDILLQFKEVLVWISPLHQACETSSQILAAATTLLEEIRMSIINNTKLKNIDAYANTAYDPWADPVPMADQVSRLPPAEVRMKNLEIARVIDWHEWHKDDFMENVFYRADLWPAMVLLINCKHFLDSNFRENA